MTTLRSPARPFAALRAAAGPGLVIHERGHGPERAPCLEELLCDTRGAPYTREAARRFYTLHAAGPEFAFLERCIAYAARPTAQAAQTIHAEFADLLEPPPPPAAQETDDFDLPQPAEPQSPRPDAFAPAVVAIFNKLNKTLHPEWQRQTPFFVADTAPLAASASAALCFVLFFTLLAMNVHSGPLRVLVCVGPWTALLVEVAQLVMRQHVFGVRAVDAHARARLHANAQRVYTTVALGLLVTMLPLLLI